MTVLFHLWRKAANERNALGREVDQLRLDLAVANAHIEDLEAHLELMAIENTDLEKTVAAYTQGIFWFDGRTA